MCDSFFFACVSVYLGFCFDSVLLYIIFIYFSFTNGLTLRNISTHAHTNTLTFLPGIMSPTVRTVPPLNDYNYTAKWTPLPVTQFMYIPNDITVPRSTSLRAPFFACTVNAAAKIKSPESADLDRSKIPMGEKYRY